MVRRPRRTHSRSEQTTHRCPFTRMTTKAAHKLERADQCGLPLPHILQQTGVSIDRHRIRTSEQAVRELCCLFWRQERGPV